MVFFSEESERLCGLKVGLFITVQIGTEVTLAVDYRTFGQFDGIKVRIEQSKFMSDCLVIVGPLTAVHQQWAVWLLAVSLSLVYDIAVFVADECQAWLIVKRGGIGLRIEQFKELRVRPQALNQPSVINISGDAVFGGDLSRFHRGAFCEARIILRIIKVVQQRFFIK